MFICIFFFVEMTSGLCSFDQNLLAQSAGAVEYTDCFSAEG